MKTSLIIRLLLISIFVVGSMVPAQAAIDYVFDEYGNGWYNQSNAGWVVNPGYVAADPASPTGQSLRYNLLGIVIGGDVPIWESIVDTDPALLSDVLRFTAIPGTSQSIMIFYSDPPEPGEIPSLADTGFPADLNLGDGGGIVEVAGAFTYLVPGTRYFGYSDIVAPNPVPEPATMLLLGSGLLGLWGARKKFKK